MQFEILCVCIVHCLYELLFYQNSEELPNYESFAFINRVHWVRLRHSPGQRNSEVKQT